jgi:hypothetical protein
MGISQIQCPTGLDSWSAVFSLLYINDLPKIINKNNNLVLFADDTSILVTDINKINFETNLNHTFKNINTWFNANLLILNSNKTEYVKFQPMNYYNTSTPIIYDQINLTNITVTKFLGVIIDDIFHGNSTLII